MQPVLEGGGSPEGCPHLLEVGGDSARSWGATDLSKGGGSGSRFWARLHGWSKAPHFAGSVSHTRFRAPMCDFL